METLFARLVSPACDARSPGAVRELAQKSARLPGKPSRERDRRFESRSLQRRVRCEPDC